MKTFTKIVENSGFKNFKVSADITLIVSAENEGEAGYISDSVLGSVDNQFDFKIKDISMTTENLNESQKTSEWIEKNNKLEKTYTFDNFKESVKFMNLIFEVADSVNHHPEIKNIYNKVTIKLSTHDVGKVTEKDKRISKKIDSLWKQM